MSVSFNCHCAERKKSVSERAWGVYQRKCNYSAFSGYRRTPSAYSGVQCFACNAIGRTKAAFVDELPDIVFKDGEWKYATPQPNRIPAKEQPEAQRSTGYSAFNRRR